MMFTWPSWRLQCCHSSSLPLTEFHKLAYSKKIIGGGAKFRVWAEENDIEDTLPPKKPIFNLVENSLKEGNQPCPISCNCSLPT